MHCYSRHFKNVKSETALKKICHFQVRCTSYILQFSTSHCCNIQ